MNGGDFGRRAAAAFDGAVHVSLPLDAGVLAGEEETAAGTREPGAQRRIERGIEIRIAAARQRVVLPDDLTGSEQRGALRSEPVERVGEPLRAVARDHRLRRVARAAAGEQREDAGAAALFLVAVPDRAERQRRAERPRPSGDPPEPFGKLEQRLRRAPVLQPGDRVVLLAPAGPA